MSNPYATGTLGIPPVDLAKKAGNLQLLGILSIVFGVCPCCPIVGLVLGIIVTVQAPGVLAMLQQAGGPPDLIGKVNTGKICGIIGLVLGVLALAGNLIYGVVAVMNR